MPVHDDSRQHNSTHVADDRLAKHAGYALVWGALESEEQALLELANTPNGFHEFERQMRLCDAREGDGTSVVSLCKDEHGEYTDWAKVKAIEPVHPSAAELGELMLRRGLFAADGLAFSERQIRRRIESAYRKIREHRIYQSWSKGEE